MSLVRLCSKFELPADGHATEITVNGHTICVANVNGEVAAMDNVCVHRGGPLGQGAVEGDKIVCPWHGWSYDPHTCRASHDGNARVAVYPVRIQGEDVMAEM